jgi:chromosome segregation ATPase
MSLSQIDTNKICFDYITVREISKDLIKCDSIQNELEYTQNVISIQENRLNLKDKALDNLLQQIINYEIIIDTYEPKIELYKKREEELNQEIQQLNIKNSRQKTAIISTTSASIALGIILFIFISK